MSGAAISSMLQVDRNACSAIANTGKSAQTQVVAKLTGSAMSDTKTPKPTEPLFAAIELIWRKAISVWNFYWKMIWRPRLFAEEYLQTPTVSSIKRAAQHTLW